MVILLLTTPQCLLLWLRVKARCLKTLCKAQLPVITLSLSAPALHIAHSTLATLASSLPLPRFPSSSTPGPLEVFSLSGLFFPRYTHGCSLSPPSLYINRIFSTKTSPDTLLMVDSKRRPQYFAAPLLKSWNLFPIPWIWVGPVTSLDQQNVVELMFVSFRV